MKKLMTLVLGAMCLGQVAIAQTDDDMSKKMMVNQQKYDRYLNDQVKADYRTTTMNAISLTDKERKEFEPILSKYLEEKAEIMEKKMKLIESYREEMAEDDGVKNQNEDRADFIEDYWEEEIAEMELRKDCHDKLENKIPNDKATRFFLWESAVDNNISNSTVADVIPAVFDLEMYSANNPVWSKKAKEMRTKTQPKPMDASDKDYKKYVDAKLQMDFRNESIRALNLTKEEIPKFDAFLKDYMTEQERLFEKRMNLIEELNEELAEDDGMENEEEDKADFMEDYWENLIAEVDLRKDNFDELEDKIAKTKAAKFFFWEKAIQDRIVLNSLYDVLPTLSILEMKPADNGNTMTENTTKKDDNMNMMMSATTKNSIESFDKWFKASNGQVDISHDYTSNGLKAMVNVIESLKNDKKMSIADFAIKKSTILDNANKMTEDWKSLKHADMAKKAFVAASDLMANFDKGSMNATAMRNAANSINVDKKMTPQASKIYNFFEAANTRFQQIYQSGMTSSK